VEPKSRSKRGRNPKKADEGEESSEAMSSPEKSSPLKATTSTFDDEELEPGEVPSVSSGFKEFQGDDGADDDYDPSAERPSSDLEQELEPGEVSRKKPKNAAASPVKIALSAKSIKEENIEIVEHSFEEIASKLELMEQLDMTDKRTLDQMDEEVESPSPKKLKLDQPIITGPKKVMRVLLKKVSTPAGTPIPRLSRASKTSANSFLKQVTSSSKIMIDADDDNDYSSPSSPKKQIRPKGLVPITHAQLKALQSGKAKLTKLHSNSPLLSKLKKSGTMEKNRKCLVPKCGNVSGLFHQIPTNETRKKIWLSILGMQEFQLSGPLKNMKLCQAHFTPDSYSDDLVLRKDAYPSLQVPCPLIPWFKGKNVPYKVRNAAYGQPSDDATPKKTGPKILQSKPLAASTSAVTSAIQGFSTKCIVINCTNPSSTFCHAFPKEDETQRQAWIRACIGKDEWEGEMEKSEVPRICEDHFTLDSFETTEDEEAHKVLMPDAIPTLKLKLDKPPTEENDSKPTEIDNGSENAKDGIFETDLIEKEKCCIPSCKSPGVVFHRFPQDARMQSAWVAACDVNNINIKSSFICEKHFTEDSYKQDLVNELLDRPVQKLLKWDAVPTINVPFVVTAIKAISTETEIQTETPEKDGSSKLRCVVSLCSSEKDVFYHNFPEFGSRRYVAWCEACDINQKSQQESKICSKHFTKDSYQFALRLKPDAVPTIDVPFLVMLSYDGTENDSSLKLNHPSILSSPNKSEFKSKKSKVKSAMERASARSDALASLIEDCGISSYASPKSGKLGNKKSRMRNFGVQCRMKSDETESLRQRLKDEKRSKACERAKLSQERAKLRKWNSEDNVRKVVRDWLRKRYNDKQTKFLMSKPEREELLGEDEELEPGEQRSSATILAARAAKEGLAKARAALNNTTKAANTSIEQLEPGEVQHKVTVVVEDDELEPGEVRR